MSKIFSPTFITNAKALCLGVEQQKIESPKSEPTPSGITTKAIHLWDKSYHEKRIETLAKYYIEKLKLYLEANPRRSVPDALKDKLVYTDVRNFLRNDGVNHGKNPLIVELKKLHLAAKLGITPEVMDANEGFESYARNSLERYLLKFSEEIKVDPFSKEISLKFEGEYTPWSEIYKAKVKRDENPNGDLRYHWHYNRNGVQWNKDFFIFDTLEPMFIRKDLTEEEKIDTFEVCAIESVKTWLAPITGVHVWFRIKTSDGRVYCLGVYRPAKTGFLDHFDRSFRIKQAYFGHEISEFWPMDEDDFRSIEVQITPEQRDKILEKFMRDAKDPEKTFQISQGNCVVYASDILRDIVGVTLPTEQSLFGLLNPKRFHWITNQIPRKIREICVAVGAIFVNLLQVALGATLVDKKVKAKNVKPLISSFWDIFNPKKALGYHPYSIFTKTHDWVQNWRKKEAMRLEKEHANNKPELEKQLRSLKTQLPPKSELPLYY